MAIEIPEFTDVSISVSPVGVSGGNFGILGFLTTDADLAIIGKSITPAERARSYTGLASVGGDWQTGSEVFKAATAFYGQTPTPQDFTVLMNYRTAQKASLIGGGTPTAAELILAAWNGTGSFDISIDGVDVSIADLDVSGAVPATFDGIASYLEGRVQGVLGLEAATVVHNGYQFVITGITSGSAGVIGFAADSDAARDLGLTQSSAKISVGIDPETAVQSLATIGDHGIDYVGLVTNKLFRDAAFADDSGDSAVDIAVAAEGFKKIFCNTTNDLTTLITGSTNVASKLKDKTLRFSLSTFSKDVNSYPSASVFGRAASVEFESIGSTITLNLKQIPGISAEDLTPAEFAALRSYYCSAVVQIGKTVNAYTDSRMASGSWLDTTHGILWLENKCETDMFNLLYVSNTKIPFTQVGINMAADVLGRSLQAAIRNGLAAPGYLSDGTYLPEGYIVEAVPLAQVSVGDKGNRVYSGLSFKLVGAGAMHEITVSGSFSE